MSRLLGWLGVIGAAVLALLAALAGARRRGEAVGAAKSKAHKESEHVDQLVLDAHRAADMADALRASPKLSGESDKVRAERQRVADTEAREAALRLHDDIMRRVRGDK